MIQVSLTREMIQLASILEGGNESYQGAQVVFTGAVRTPNQGQKVLGVSYDAFEPLARRILEEICFEAVAQWGQDLSIHAIHRLGRLNVGDISVVIVVSSRHRDEAYQASRMVIEELKNRVPIWKQEHYEGGDSQWLQGHSLCGHHGPKSVASS